MSRLMESWKWDEIGRRAQELLEDTQTEDDLEVEEEIFECLAREYEDVEEIATLTEGR